MKVTSQWAGDMAFTMINPDGQEMQMDTTLANGGGNGITPMEGLLGALSGCMGIDMMSILRRYKDNLENITFEMDGTQNDGPPNFFTHIDITVNVDGDVPADRVWRAIRLSDEKYCSVRHSLKSDVSYRLVLNGKEAPEA